MRVLGLADDAAPMRATGRVGALRLTAAGGGAVTSTGGRFWTLVSSSCAAPAGIAKTNPDTSPVETDAINKRRLNQRALNQRVLNQRALPIPAFPSVTTGCFDLRRSVERSVMGSRARASHKRSGN